MKKSSLALGISYLVYLALWAYVWVIRFYLVFPYFNYNILYNIVLSAFSGATVFPLYLIAKKRLNTSTAFLISLAYLLYFPLAGLNWAGNAEALFPFLFLTAYYLYSERKYSASALLYALGSLIGPLPSLLSFGFSSYQLWNDRKKLSYVPFFVSLASFVTYALLHRFPAFTLSMNNAYSGAFAVIILLIPLLFAPLISYWGFSVLVLLFFALLSNGFQYPEIILSGYIAPFIPFIFLGLIEASEFFRDFDDKGLKVFSAVFIINVTLFAAVYQPFSPLNSYSSLDYGLTQVIGQYNQVRAVYENLSSMLNLVPSGSSVLMQNSFFPSSRVKIYLLNEVSPSSLTSFKYVLVGPNSSAMQQVSGISMASIAEKLYSMNYGVLAEAYDMVLLEKNYSGPPAYYKPTTVTWSSNQIVTLGKTFRYNNEIVDTNAEGIQVWYLPYNFIPPGNYTMIIYLKQNMPSGSNLMSLAIFADNLTLLLNMHYISNDNVNTSWTKVVYSFTVPKLYSNVEVFAYVYSWKGSIFLSNVTITQASFKAYNQ